MGDKTHYDLYYYTTRGLCEPIRYILSYGGASFSDNRTPLTSFSPITPLPAEWRERALFGQVPILEFEGKQLTQSQAIVRYLARKFELVGKDDWEAAKCDELGDAALDFARLWSPLYGETDEAKRKEAIDSALSMAKERYLPKFNALAESGGGGHLVGGRLTWADISVAHFIDIVSHVHKVDVLGEDYPALRGLLQTVFSTPGIKEYIEKRVEN